MAAVRGAGFSSWVSDDSKFEQLRRDLDEAAGLGVEFVELPLFVMDLIAGGRVLPAQVRRLKEAIEGRGLGYTAHGPIAVNFMEPELLSRHFAVAKAAVEVAAEIGAVNLVLHTGLTQRKTKPRLRLPMPSSAMPMPPWERSRRAVHLSSRSRIFGPASPACTLHFPPVWPGKSRR